MSFVMIPEELLDVNMSAAQFRALIHIINNTYSNGKYAGCCCLGYQNLAKLCFTNKPVMIKIVQQLEELGFVEINRRERFNRSNAIKLTLESGLERCRCDVGESHLQTHTEVNERYLKDTDERYLKDTDERYLKDTEGYLKHTQGYLKDTPHIDLKFKNLDLKNKKTRASDERYLKDTFDDIVAEGNHIAPADGAAGRSMPERGQAAQESAKEVQAQALADKQEITSLWRECCAEFKQIADDVELVQAENQMWLREKSKFQIMARARALEASEWLKKRGLTAEVLDWGVYFVNETIIKGEAA